jgi:hypothetical protein
LLYRLAKSEFADHFLLKRAAMLLVWMGDASRPTKDIDLLGFGDTPAEGLQRIFVAICENQRARLQGPTSALLSLPRPVAP